MSAGSQAQSEPTAASAQVEVALREIASDGRAWLERGVSASWAERREGRRDWGFLGRQLANLAAIDPDECEAFGRMVLAAVGDSSGRGNPAWMAGAMALSLADFGRHPPGEERWADGWGARARVGADCDDEGGFHAYSYVEMDGDEPGPLDENFHQWSALAELAEGISADDDDQWWSAHELMEESARDWGFKGVPTESHAQAARAAEAYVEARALRAEAGAAPRRPAARV